MHRPPGRPAPVTFVVGYAPGGSNDINARELAALMSPILGQQIVVDNKGGANGSLGLRAVAGAKPDGYTLSYTSAQTIVVNPWVQKGMIDTLTTLMPTARQRITSMCWSPTRRCRPTRPVLALPAARQNQRG